MRPPTAIVVTSIGAPNEALSALSDGASVARIPFYVIGDLPSPPDFYLPGCNFFDIRRQERSGLRTATLAPTRHYARKNIGYLLAIKDGANTILETDDDNIPTEAFWKPRRRLHQVASVEQGGWVNVYSYFSSETIWPRGFPLDTVRSNPPSFDSLRVVDTDCPIQQGLADDDPDVDAVYRLMFPRPINFRRDRSVALGSGSWCPFNSQNTTWSREAFALMYLPAFCTFRMTDIWRSLVAQRITWANGWSILFHEPTVRQSRNEHNLMSDFRDEIPGYLNNRGIAELLERVPVVRGVEHLTDNLLMCYEALVRVAILPPTELPLLNAWIEDLAAVRPY